MVSDTNLIWIDLEMTGLDTQNDRIIEIATIVTDADLAILAEGPVIHIPLHPLSESRRLDDLGASKAALPGFKFVRFDDARFYSNRVMD